MEKFNCVAGKRGFDLAYSLGPQQGNCKGFSKASQGPPDFPGRSRPYRCYGHQTEQRNLALNCVPPYTGYFVCKVAVSVKDTIFIGLQVNLRCGLEMKMLHDEVCPTLMTLGWKLMCKFKMFPLVVVSFTWHT